ncbi:hypothetical protein [Parasitella parasitica]|uniref:Uncharacterized protein n=1 Tax=Parasitella parasitica TaxID=35722 RepID=A0A0B7NWW6_9FUNG|nr:hypothetical protein [Parasitella parasitica]
MAMRIDIICTIFIILPFITTNISSIAAAVSVLQWNAKAARVYAGVLYYQWLVYWSILAIMIFIAGLRLIKILEEHLRNQIEAGNGAHVQKIRNGLFKAGSHDYGSQYQFHATVPSTLVVITVLLNPSALGAFSVSSNQEALHEPKVDAHTNFAVRTDEVTLIASDIENGKDSYDLHRQSLDHLSQDRKNYKCASADKMI